MSATTAGTGAIRPGKVRITRSWLVDCDVCGEAVEPESGNFLSRRKAEEAKARHLAEHEQGDFL